MRIDFVDASWKLGDEWRDGDKNCRQFLGLRLDAGEKWDCGGGLSSQEEGSLGALYGDFNRTSR